MKQLLWMGFMVLLAGGLCACGQRQKPQETSQTDKPAPTAAVTPLVSSDEAFSAAEDMVKNMTLEEKIGQMFMVDLLQLDENPSVDGSARKITKDMKSRIAQYHIGGVYLTRENIQKKEQTQRLIRDLQDSAVTGGALYVAVEEDGGGAHSISSRVADLTETGYVTPREMGQNMTSQQIYESGKTIAGELTELGVNLNLAPVADIGSEINPQYAERCLGTDADMVSELLDNYVMGMRDGGLAVTLKHFPGIGNVAGDVTETILENQDSLMTLRNNNFSPYSSGIGAGADCVMVSNVAVSKVTVKKIPAFMSEDVVTKLLREELDFEGIIMTSPMNDNVIRNNYTYEFATVEAVKAGCDMIVLPGNLQECYEALLNAVETGRINEKVINTSVRRILQNKIQRGILVLQ